MERLLRSKLREQNREDHCDHCCAETLASFTENKLGSTEREQVACHLSLCQSCRDTLALACQANGATREAEVPQPRFRIAWLGAVAAVLCLSTSILYVHSGIRPAVKQEPLPLPATSAKVSPAKGNSRIKEPGHSQQETGTSRTVSPRLAEAVVGARGIDKTGSTWKVDTVQYPAALESSRDGGRTWKQVNISGFQPKFVAWKDTKVWAVDSQGRIMQSTDNGDHWTRLQHTVHARPTQ
jgi:hypothetical protein